MVANQKISEIEKIMATLVPSSALRNVLGELTSMFRRESFHLSFSLTNGTANTMPVYSASEHALVGAHVSFRDDLPNFVHEMTHARVLECYRSDMVNYYCPDNSLIPLEFGSSPIPGAPANTVSLLEMSLNNRRRARYRTNCKTVLEGNLHRLREIAQVADYSETPNTFMSPEQKKILKAPIRTQEELDRHTSVSSMMAAVGLVQKSRKFIGSARINAERLDGEQERKKTWILERINYGLNGMGGLGDVHFEYDTVVNQMLVQMHLWGYKESHDLFRAIANLAEEAHERRISASTSTPPVIRDPRALLTTV